MQGCALRGLTAPLVSAGLRPALTLTCKISYLRAVIDDALGKSLTTVITNVPALEGEDFTNKQHLSPLEGLYFTIRCP